MSVKCRINPQNEAAKKGLDRLEKLMKVGQHYIGYMKDDIFSALQTFVGLLNAGNRPRCS